MSWSTQVEFKTEHRRKERGWAELCRELAATPSPPPLTGPRAVRNEKSQGMLGPRSEMVGGQAPALGEGLLSSMPLAPALCSLYTYTSHLQDTVALVNTAPVLFMPPTAQNKLNTSDFHKPQSCQAQQTQEEFTPGIYRPVELALHINQLPGPRARATAGPSSGSWPGHVTLAPVVSVCS